MMKNGNLPVQMYMIIVKEIYMSKSTELSVKVKIGLKSFITVISILVVVLIAVGVLTYVIPAGRYTIYTTDQSKIGQPFFEYTADESLNKQIVIDSYRELADGENTSRIPFYRWLTSPIEALLLISKLKEKLNDE